MTRRELLALASVLAGRGVEAESVPNPRGRLGMGGAPTAFSARRAAAGRRDGSFSDEFLDYCHSLGLGGAEMGLPPTDSDAIRSFRGKLQSYGMHVIFNVPLPRSADDLERFSKAVYAAKESGAYGLHAALTGRRYEDLHSLDAYRASFAANRNAVALAEPILRQHKVRLAIENHKGWRAVEQAEWMKQISSEYVGVHFDFGNNMVFCEDPLFTLDTLQPWIFSGHIKDMAVQPYADGFLLSEVPFGEGILDLRKMVDVIRGIGTEIPLDLEMITRDPLKVPIFRAQYWETLQDIPGRQVAQTMELVQRRASPKPLPSIAGLDPTARERLEESYNLACIRYARRHLGL